MRSAVLIVGTALVFLVGNGDFQAVPRFDGAGYAVLARSLGEGSGYREIDHPDAPRHAHFPPLYPLVLAGLWQVTGPSLPVAHGFSIACTVAAVFLSWRVFTSWFHPGVALLLGLAVAANWRWGREGSAIRAEPLFFALEMAAVRVAIPTRTLGGIGRAVGLGVLLGAAILTRHVGVALAVAVLVDLVWSGRRREAMVAAVVAAVLVAPWVVWLVVVGRGTQAELIPARNLLGIVSENAVFYLRRLPDQWFGPIIEVFTVFRPRWIIPATLAAAAGSLGIVAGWLGMLRSRSHRVAGLVPLFALCLLLIWPFTEAGRFLEPLIPFLLVGILWSASWLLAISTMRRFRIVAAGVILLATIPYCLYALAARRAESARIEQRPFEAVCRWIGQQSPPGPVLSRHPGEVFWLSGRKGVSAPSVGDVVPLIARYRVAFLLIDEARYAKAPTTPLARFVAEHPDRVERCPIDARGIEVYRVRPRNGG